MEVAIVGVDAMVVVLMLAAGVEEKVVDVVPSVLL